MTITNLLGLVYQKDKLLFRVGLYMFILFVLLFIPFSIDNRQILGINPWIKPMKFCLSIGIYVWTIAWFLDYLKAYKRWKISISILIAFSMAIEMLVILIQAGRGETSHFNISSALNAALFSSMGIMIAISTLATVAVLYLFFIKPTSLDRVYLNSIRVGLAIFLLASYVGGIMIGNMAHSVGVEDGGPGLPFLNWSQEGGDLRAAHFFGLHAIQIFPLFTYYIKSKTDINSRNRMFILFLFTIVFVSILAYLFSQAMAGKPLLSM